MFKQDRLLLEAGAEKWKLDLDCQFRQTVDRAKRHALSTIFPNYHAQFDVISRIYRRSFDYT